jgi:hypothetical protein
VRGIHRVVGNTERSGTSAMRKRRVCLADRPYGVLDFFVRPEHMPARPA